MRIKLRRFANRTVALCILVLFFFITRPASKTGGENDETCHVTRLGSWKSFVKYIQLRRNITKMSRDWQSVTDQGDMFVYSAFREKLFPDRIRIIGSSYVLSWSAVNVFCLYYYDDDDHTLLMVPAHEILVFDGHWFKYYTAFFVCPLCGLPLPDRISLVDEAHVYRPNNILPVHDQTVNQIQYNITSCVSPMFNRGNSSDAEGLIEWFEINMILGVQFFNIYVHKTSETKMKVLEYYQSIGKAEVMSWSMTGNEFIKVVGSGGIHYRGQLAALNDCLYRNKGRANYMVTYDLDELMIPRIPDDVTLLDIVKRLPEKSVYSVRNVYFKHGVDPRNCTVKNDCLSKIDNTLKDTRTNYLFYPTDVNKLILKPRHIATIGVHHPFAVRSGSEYMVPENICLLHHFSSKFAKDSERRFLPDNASSKYRDVVLKHVIETANKINASP